MFRQPHRCAFVIGALLVLLAVVLVVHFDFTTTQQAHQYRRARIAQSVSQLNNGCLTCHAIVNDAPQIEPEYVLVRSLNHPRQEARDAQAAGTDASVSLLQDQLNTQLIATGQRILNLSDRRTQRAERIEEDYLLVYELASAARDPHEVRLALWRLNGMEDDLRVLEHQASPFQLVRQHIRHDQANPTALQTLTSMSGVAIVTPDQAIDSVAFVAFAQPETAQLAMPQEMVIAICRRGPPAAAFLDSVL